MFRFTSFIRYVNRNLAYKDEKLKLQKLESYLVFCRSRCLCVSQEIKENPMGNVDYLEKVIYNEVLRKLNYLEQINKRKNQKQKRNRDGSRINTPICLKYLEENASNEKNASNENETKDEQEVMHSEVVQFPYDVQKKFLTKSTVDQEAKEIFSESLASLTPCDNEKVILPKHPLFVNESFRNEFGSHRNERKLENDNINDVIRFGTSDPNEPVSSVPCGGCGAFLHCTDPSVPGYLPKEVFKGSSKAQLRSEICQRCHFLKEFNVALGVNVSSSEYPKIIESIREKKALVILMIDVIDFPCSIWPGIMELIGPKPVIIVANKVDLIIKENPSYLTHIKQSIMKSLEDQGVEMKNVKHVALISAKTGFGIEELINSLYKNWWYRGDVYIVGCTNVGKSTLFNALIQSDYCKVKAVDLMQRATISAWPGTTLNLLKFPIMKARTSLLNHRFERLSRENKQKAAFQKLENLNHNVKLQQKPLQGYVGRTYIYSEPQHTSDDIFASNRLGTESQPMGLDPDDPDFSKGHWCYDTPGVIHHDQIINLLTTSELQSTLPKQMLIPRNFRLKPGHSLFIAGLARLDYFEGTDFAWFTVYASKLLPITVTKLEDADFVYESLLGSNLFCVPSGGKLRLSKWPKFSSKKFDICGKGMNSASADIVLSSAGWISLTVPSAHRCAVEAWTPEGRGIYMRRLPIVQTGFMFRGNRIPRTPAYATIMKETEAIPFTKHYD